MFGTVLELLGTLLQHVRNWFGTVSDFFLFFALILIRFERLGNLMGTISELFGNCRETSIINDS